MGRGGEKKCVGGELQGAHTLQWERQWDAPLLVLATGTRTTKLLGLAATGIGNQECSVVLDEHILNLILRGLVLVCL
jgi:hypothetical protein